jgi:hypothetical protein
VPGFALCVQAWLVLTEFAMLLRNIYDKLGGAFLEFLVRNCCAYMSMFNNGSRLPDIDAADGDAAIASSARLADCRAHHCFAGTGMYFVSYWDNTCIHPPHTLLCVQWRWHLYSSATSP